ncbi:hypothetical protein OROMI_008128 [Orobanche minor]
MASALIVIRLRAVASALIVIRLRAVASALIVIRLRAVASALIVIRLRAVASALIVIRLRAVASALIVIRLRAVASALIVIRLRAVASALIVTQLRAVLVSTISLIVAASAEWLLGQRDICSDLTKWLSSHVWCICCFRVSLRACSSLSIQACIGLIYLRVIHCGILIVDSPCCEDGVGHRGMTKATRHSSDTSPELFGDSC